MTESRFQQRLHKVPDPAVQPLLDVLEDFADTPAAPSMVRFFGSGTKEYREFVAGEPLTDAIEILGVTDTHTFRLTLGPDAADLAVRAASVLQDDVMDETGSLWPEVPVPGLGKTAVLEPVLANDGSAIWEGGGRRCPIGQLRRTFGPEIHCA